ncbi:MAG: ribose 5-phosphate isomerase B [Planctomycetota bacterium]
MKVGIASDHRGYDLKSRMVQLVQQLEWEPLDFGPDAPGSVDYPDFGAKVAEAVSAGEVDRGLLICGNGLGMGIVANKFPGVRATPCHDDVTAGLCREHNDANVLCLSADLLGERVATRIVETFLTTEFAGGRHARRVEKISVLDSSLRDSDRFDASAIDTIPH